MAGLAHSSKRAGENYQETGFREGGLFLEGREGQVEDL